MRERLPSDMVNAIRRMYASGYDTREIANACGVSRNKVVSLVWWKRAQHKCAKLQHATAN